MVHMQQQRTEHPARRPPAAERPGDRFITDRTGIDDGGRLHGQRPASRPERHAMVAEDQQNSPPQLKHLEVGDAVRAGGAEFRVTAAVHRRRIVQLELEAPDGEHATLIGVPGAPIPF